MHPNWPLRWPLEWRDPATLDLLKGTPVGFLVFSGADGYQAVMERARRMDLAVCDADHPPSGVQIVKGEWPGIRMSPGQGDASGGPTGAPWIDSNGWLVRLARAGAPGPAVWVISDPPKNREIVPLTRHLVAVADSAAHGGRWIITLDSDLADNLAAAKPSALDGWRRVMATIRFFEEHPDWTAWSVDAVLAVVSSFSGDDEFFSRELLNLAARTNVSYSIVPAGGLRPETLQGLRAALYPDSRPPSPANRQTLLQFVERGGLLITTPSWGEAPGLPLPEEMHPRYALRQFGKGRIAMAVKQPEDPYEVAQDAQIILSHRYDRVRIFNGALLGTYCTVSSDGRRRLIHTINYGGAADDDPATARIAGSFRSARLWSPEQRDARPLEMVPQRGGVEVHLPRLAVYGGVELGA